MAFSLPEVMIAMVMIMMMCTAVFPGLHFVSRSAMNVAIRSEAHRLMQAEAERLMSVGFSSFKKSDAEEPITSSIKTTFNPDKSGKFVYPTSQAGRIVFKRNVTEVSSTATTRTLLIKIQWVWQGRTVTISTPVFRSV